MIQVSSNPQPLDLLSEYAIHYITAAGLLFKIIYCQRAALLCTCSIFEIHILWFGSRAVEAYSSCGLTVPRDIYIYIFISVVLWRYRSFYIPLASYYLTPPARVISAEVQNDQERHVNKRGILYKWLACRPTYYHV